MSYKRDNETHRGIGAIAAIDAVGTRRRREQRRKNRVMAVIDARHAQLAHGPRRALPVPIGAISLTSDGGAGAGGATTTSPSKFSTSSLSTITAVATSPTQPTGYASPIIGTMTTVTPSKGDYTQPPSGYASPIIATTPGIIVEPAPITTATGGTKAAYVPKSPTGGGSGLAPTVPVPPQFVAPAPVVDLPEPSGSLSTKTLVMVGAGIGLLWLLTRDRND